MGVMVQIPALITPECQGGVSSHPLWTWGSPSRASRTLSKTLLKSLSGSDRSFVSEVHYSHISQSILHQTKGAENTSSCVLTYLCYISGWLMLGFQFGNIRNITHFGSKIETDHAYEVKQHNTREGHPGGGIESRLLYFTGDGLAGLISYLLRSSQQAAA